MNRYAKTFSQPERPDDIPPISNKFTIDLMGLSVSEEQLGRIRSEAVKAALVAAADLLKGKEGVFDDFGTFSTFSTFSTFGSGAAELPRVELPSSVDQDAARVIGRALGGRKKGS